MKYRYLFLSLAALAVSCSIEEVKSPELEDPNAPVFFATIDEQPDADTKVYADSQLRVLWNEDDRVTIFNKNTYNQQYRFTGEDGDNAGAFRMVPSDDLIMGGDIDKIYAVYPYRESTKITYDGIITTAIPSEQTYKENSFGIGSNTMTAMADGNMLKFKNVGGYLSLKFYGEGVSISSITLKSNNGELIAGECKVDMSSGLPETSLVASNATDEITLTCETPVELGATAEDAVQFIFVLSPVTMTGGFTVTVTTPDGRVFEKSSTRERVIGRSAITLLGAMEVVVPLPVPEAVDLGLPSGLKWASFNIGASNPEEYGDYFAFGELEPKSDYSWSNYMWCNGSSTTLTKYNFFSDDGTIDNKSVLDAEDDVAHVKYGGKWRMPIDAEWTELKESCTWTWTTQNDVNGYLVTGPNGNSIFLPAAGRRSGAYLYYDGVHGCYWSSTLKVNSGGTQCLWFGSGGILNNEYPQCVGFPIRPVLGNLIHPKSITLNKTSLLLSLGSSEKLITTISPENAAIKDVFWSSSDTSVAFVSSSGDVTAMAAGTAIITVTTGDGGKTGTCSVTVQSDYYVPEAVDMGLSVKWASFNIGASTPEGFGAHYAWGETEPRPYNDLNSDFRWSHYLWCNGTADSLTKYNTNNDYGIVDNRRMLEAEDDVAHVKFGDQWRMPIDAEWTELRENCTWTWTSLNGINGYEVTAANGNSIFLPAAGSISYYYYEGAGLYGNYWSSSLNATSPYKALGVTITDGNVSGTEPGRASGLTVRPVYGEIIHPESVTLNKSSLSLSLGSSEKLIATISPAIAPNKTVTWLSSDTSVATVSSSGVVRARTAGTATITVTTNDEGKTATCSVIVEAEDCVPDAVDLGLPSGLKWASFNVGASAPEDYGDYYAWGETEPYYSSQDPLTWKDGKEIGYDWTSYTWCNGSEDILTKYNFNSDWGTLDNKKVLDPEDDVAHVKYGGNWRMPTDAEWTELIDNCTWTWTTQNDVNGRLVTGPNGNSIFLPAAGSRTTTKLSMGSYGEYWSSSLRTGYPRNAFDVLFYLSSFVIMSDNGSSRYCGYSVRPVSD